MINKFKIKFLKVIMITLAATSFLACSNDDDDYKKTTTKVERRWYTTEQLTNGKKVFKNNCAVCHGNKGQGLSEDWKKKLPDGTYPAPPLNGSAHAWHHGKEQLLRTINSGGVPLGGVMPAFKDKLSEEEKEAVMAYFMSLWSDRIYEAWLKWNPN